MNPNLKHYNSQFSGEKNKVYNDLMSAKFEKIAKLVTGKERRVLDIGCGNGTIRTLFGKNVDYYGVDICDAALIKSKAKGIITKRVDLNKGKLPYKNNSFDTVICTDIIEHIMTPEVILSEIYRVLEPGGRIICVVPNISSWQNRLAIPLGFFPWAVESTGNMPMDNILFHINYGHLKAFNKNTINALIKIAGFKDAKYTGVPFRFNLECAKALTKGSIYNHLPRFVFSAYNATDALFSKMPSIATLILVHARK